MKHTFKPLRAKTDDSGIRWQVCECARCGLLRRQTEQNGWSFTRTLLPSARPDPYQRQSVLGSAISRTKARKTADQALCQLDQNVGVCHKS